MRKGDVLLQFHGRVMDEKENFLLVVNLDFLLVHDRNNYPMTHTQVSSQAPKVGLGVATPL
jgi:hypothetical protein